MKKRGILSEVLTAFNLKGRLENQKLSSSLTFGFESIVSKCNPFFA